MRKMCESGKDPIHGVFQLVFNLEPVTENLKTYSSASSSAKWRNFPDVGAHTNRDFVDIVEGLLRKSLSLTIYVKATEQYFPVVLFIMLYKVVLSFKSVDEFLKCHLSNESY